MTLTLKNKNVPKTLGLLLSGFSHTRPIVTIKARDKLFLVNLTGVRPAEINKVGLIKKVEELCKDMGQVLSISTCARDFYDKKPVSKDEGFYKRQPLVKWTTPELTWYTFK